jgi:L-ascorbate metabolism protein UlaG (beta-lactamase superfamily)
MATLRLVRHATLLIDYAGRRLLVDPMLSPRGALDPAAGSANSLRNPLVDLPMPLSEVLAYDECLVTHAHRDHLDAAALAALPKDRPVLCQPEDRARLLAAGFREVVPVANEVERWSIAIARTVGEHGRGPMAEKMGPSSGYVLRHGSEPTLFIAGDTVRGAALQAALRAHRPEAIVLNAGAAQFAEGGAVTLDAEEVLAVAREASLAHIAVVHLEAWNHCPMRRADLRARLEHLGMGERVRVPDDGEALEFN